MHPEEIRSVLALSPTRRYVYFIKRVADWEQVWGLYDDGWALSGTDDGNQRIPLWPTQEWAELNATGDWQTYKAKAVDLDRLIQELIPTFVEDNIAPSVFFVEEQGSIDVSWEELCRNLEEEIEENY